MGYPKSKIILLSSYTCDVSDVSIFGDPPRPPPPEIIATQANRIPPSLGFLEYLRQVSHERKKNTVVLTFHHSFTGCLTGIPTKSMVYYNPHIFQLGSFLSSPTQTRKKSPFGPSFPSFLPSDLALHFGSWAPSKSTAAKIASSNMAPHRWHAKIDVIAPKWRTFLRKIWV